MRGAMVTSRPTVRIRPVPPLDPPFDDESTAYTWWRESTGQLALDLTAPATSGLGSAGGPPVRAVERADRDLLAGTSPAPGGERLSPAGLQPWPASAGPDLRPTPTGPGLRPADPRGGPGTPAGALSPDRSPTSGPAVSRASTPGVLVTASPEARRATRRFLGCCLEILDGHRPIGHLRRLCHPVEATDLIDAFTAAVRRLARRTGTVTRRSGSALRIRVLRVCEPTDGVAEVAVVLGRIDRSWALALRLERSPDGWLCTAFELL
ncbi:Rv3235 family protein [Plantactinospora sp. GCM10030261]|uniref:Rv3235 family protein n=1 Tax=Plantactinospora sp. GCM10030261 TaxID=3273420 RepID=UPI003613AD72